jgi:predicted Fe-Mo cluster-binding NifX family protein
MGRKVAIASADGRVVDAHFGHAERFDVYELGEGGFAFVETRAAKGSCSGGRHEESSFDATLSLLSDCETVFVSVIGYGAAQYLNRKGMRVFESPYFAVEEVLRKVAAERLLESEGGAPGAKENRNGIS